jgi:protein-tyrosine phosphatase
VIDLHTHILPGVDDGVPTMEDAVAFAKVAVADGIKTIVATPHYRDGFYINPREEVLAGVAALTATLAAEGVGVEVLPGAEVHVCADLVERVKAGHAPTIADNGRTVLFELSMSQYPFDVANVVYKMRLAGLQVLFAHPERIRYFQDDVRRYEEVIRLGAFGQLTSGSALGVFGSAVEEFSEELARKGLVHVIASDAHNTRGRSPVLSRAVERVGQWVGPDLAARMVDDIPRAFLEGRDPDLPPAPEEPRGRQRSLLSRWFSRG